MSRRDKLSLLHRLLRLRPWQLLSRYVLSQTRAVYGSPVCEQLLPSSMPHFRCFSLTCLPRTQALLTATSYERFPKRHLQPHRRSR